MTDRPGPRIARALASAGVLLALGVAAAPAQEYPNRVIRVISAHAPGGGADVLIRHFAERLQAMSGQTVIVENKPGANGKIGVEHFVQSKPDGYTLLINASSAVIGNTVFMKGVDYDPNGLTPIAPVARLGFVLVASPQLGPKTFADVLAYAKSKRTKFGIQNTSARAAVELLKLEAGFNFVPVNYKGAAAVLSDVGAREIDFALGDPTSVLGQVRQGKIAPIAVTTAKRIAAFPDTPTIAESGLPGFEFGIFWAAWAPAGTPAEVVKKLEGWFQQMITSEETKAFLTRAGVEPLPGDSAALAKLTRDDATKWRTIAERAGIQKQ